MNITPEAIAHFVEWLNTVQPYYYDLNRKGWTTKEVNAYADYLTEHGLIERDDTTYPSTWSIPAVEAGTTVYAEWAVGPAQRGSGWVDPRQATNLKEWTIVGELLPGTYLVGLPKGGTITLRPGQFFLKVA
ncbi:hypothetical protein SEA_NUCCI_28 [Microbacterium phage Nucci]|nr:hypothetical protein SEA_NUCCI_28 [Microbacterium phage Nucci]QXO13622.1 hypothetical protein SEA_MANDALORIAN_28 [Microbacterium phage Mandalorian]